MQNSDHQTHRRVVRLIAITALAGAYTLAGPAGAQAATTASSQSGVLTVIAAPGVANKIYIFREGDVFRMWDHNDSPTASAGCTRINSYAMQCPAAGVTQIRVFTGDRDDSVLIENNVGVQTVIQAGDGNDRITSRNPVRDHIDGMTGNDHLEGGPGNDHIDGGQDDDSLFGQEGNDHVYGGSGQDYLQDFQGLLNYLSGDAGNDVLSGGGPDTSASNLFGGADDDKFYAYGNTSVGGGPGSDLISYQDRAVPVRADLDGLPDDGVIGTGPKDNIRADVEHIAGGTGDDILAGSDAANRITGNEGNDTIQGFGGADELFGDSGADLILGGTGADHIQGNDGNDTIDTRDSVRDLVYAGTGTDRCLLDFFIDVKLGCDIFS